MTHLRLVPALDDPFIGPLPEDVPAGTLAAAALGCTCGFTDVGTGETGPWVVAVIDEDCPLHGGTIEILGFDE